MLLRFCCYIVVLYLSAGLDSLPSWPWLTYPEGFASFFFFVSLVLLVLLVFFFSVFVHGVLLCPHHQT